MPGGPRRLRWLLSLVCMAWAGLGIPLRAQNPAAPVRQRPAVVQGRVTDTDGKAIAGASLAVGETRLGTSSDEEGRFRLEVPAGRPLLLAVTALGYQPRQVPVQGTPGEVQALDVVLLSQIIALEGVDVKASRGLEGRGEAGVVKIDPKQVQNLPSPFGDFNKTLATLPGVVSNNELSSTYSVRGGSFDENLVYVNGIEVYRPFLVRSGQQEGLSFINPDLVSAITFSSGGWQPKYGDKLSSVLNIDYKQPAALRGSLTAGLLGGAAHLEAGSKNGRVAFLGGVRQKRSQYLLNTLEVKGEYLPRFTDAQGYLHVDLSKEKSSAGLPKSELGVLFSLARNRYFTRPANRRSTFGTLTRLQQLSIVFSGEESLEYDMYQGGLKFTRRPNDRLTLHLIASAMQTTERENANVDGTYRLCDLNGQTCTGTVELGSQLQYVNNRLGAAVVSAENRSEWVPDTRHSLEWGAKVSGERIRDELNEFLLIDSAGNTRIPEQLRTGLDLNTGRFSAYAQHTFAPDNAHRFTYGGRVGYWTLNRQWLFSPSFQYTFQPAWEKEVLFKLAAGVYRQPPFYRELRDRSGVLNAGLRAQSALHLIAGAERRLRLWSRDFVLNAEAYYKNLWDVVAYDVENV
ncbi:MAG: putative ferric aerobactin receptor, partial [uncultured Cytophagales bacterium]